ncbi:MAG TPA: hypothetical protein VKX25_10855 [Bryobacteraceae bacterium]|jgi:hypothetical protein|nr:hypothetical protein [Bryobacteraceae bacterium]
MRLSIILLSLALIAVGGAIWVNWSSPTPIFYGAVVSSSRGPAVLLQYKKLIEVSVSIAAVVLSLIAFARVRSHQAPRYVACAVIGIEIGFWSHHDLIYLLKY